MTSFIRVSQKLVFHQSKCICAIKRILSTTAMYVSSSSFMYLRIACYCDAWLNSSALLVGVTTLLNTIHNNSFGYSSNKHLSFASVSSSSLSKNLLRSMFNCILCAILTCQGSYMNLKFQHRK